MKQIRSVISFLTFFSMSAAGYADAQQQQAATPFIEYHNRMAVFSLNHLVYERIKTNALYAGVEAWAVPALNHDCRLIAEGEFRLGYNFFWNGRDHFTPLAGIGFFQDLHKERDQVYHYMKPGIAYGTFGFLYEHEFTNVFNLGLNIKGLIGGPVSTKHFDWGSPVIGIDASLPITFRFGRKRHWDFRLEPFDVYLHGKHEVSDYIGFRSTIGYRF